jgi:hypothetical protein
MARAVTVVEAGSGLAFLALVIAYLPVLYQAFSRREVRISMLDERAGSPPCAGELLGRRARAYAETGPQFMRDWELWSAELLESHLSYPVLGYFRSQHDNQSWVAALTVVLDGCALILTGIEGITQGQAQLTFAMARHAAVDLAATFGVAPDRVSLGWRGQSGSARRRGRTAAERQATPAAEQDRGESGRQSKRNSSKDATGT